MTNDKEDKAEQVERRKNPGDRREDIDRRGDNRVVETEDPRRKSPDRRKTTK